MDAQYSGVVGAWVVIWAHGVLLTMHARDDDSMYGGMFLFLLATLLSCCLSGLSTLSCRLVGAKIKDTDA